MSDKLKEYSYNFPTQEVNEAFQVYLGSFKTPLPIEVNVDGLPFSSLFDHKYLVISTIQHGVSIQLFKQIQKLAPFSLQEWADYLNLSEKTLQRGFKDANFLFKPIHSEKILELSEVVLFGLDTFQSKDKFYQWLNTAALGLAGNKPLHLLKDSYGKELVMAELNRINHGIFA